MTQQRLDEAERDAAVLSLVLSTSEEGLRLHTVAGEMAQAWSTASKGLLPLADALECARNAVAATAAEVGICHAVYDAVSYRRAMPDLYPAWAPISHCTAMRFGVIAVQVWAAKGWRR